MSWSDYRLDDDFQPAKRRRDAAPAGGRKKKDDTGRKREDAGRRKKDNSGRKSDGRGRKDAGRDSRKKTDDAYRQKGSRPGRGSRSAEKPDEKLIARKKKIYDLITDGIYVPMKAKEIASLLNIPRENREELKRVLDALEREGRITRNEEGKYVKAKTEKKQGVFSAHPKGFGFVTVEGFDEDFFISPDNTGDAFHQDTVEIELLPKTDDGRRREARITRVIDHAITRVVGTYQKSGHFGFVVPDDHKITKDIFIREGDDLGADDQDKVVVTISDYGGQGKKPEGIVIEDLGAKNAPGTDILSIVKGLDIPEEFPQAVLGEADRVASVPVNATSNPLRMDLRNVPMVTIDGDDSKDLDDAVSVERDGEDFIVGVHIADVSEYVREGSELDKEALKRGTSVYLPDRVIPMLPRSLSNGICSLNQGEDRYALSCIMKVGPDGKVKDHRITESIVNINRRMTYHNVKRILVDNDPEAVEEYRELVPLFQDMLEVSKAIRARRKKKGCIDFEFPEAQIILDSEGHPTDIVPEEHSVANEMIEDFMILANCTVAKEYAKAGLPFLYRTHEVPDPEKIHDLGVFLQNFGISLHPVEGDITPKEIQELTEKIKGMPEEDLISRLVLRSMQQAKYTVDCTGHFGLAAKYYCHFTSPIRRYPDLQIHRIIKENLHGRLTGKRIEHYDGVLPVVATQTSQLERRADEAEREADKMKMAEFMQAHVGEQYDGKISGVTGWGIYVELPNTVEGMVHISKLDDDFYTYNDATFELTGERTGRRFRLGDRVRIEVEGADPELRTIDFKFVKG